MTQELLQGKTFVGAGDEASFYCLDWLMPDDQVVPTVMAKDASDAAELYLGDDIRASSLEPLPPPGYFSRSNIEDPPGHLRIVIDYNGGRFLFGEAPEEIMIGAQLRAIFTAKDKQFFEAEWKRMEAGN